MRGYISQPFHTRNTQGRLGVQPFGYGVIDEGGPLLPQQRQHLLLLSYELVDLGGFVI